MAEDLATLGFGRDVFEPEHEAYRESARRFMQQEVAPNVRRWEEEGFFPADLFRQAGKAGLLCAAIPPEYGGGGGDMRHHLILHEEHAYTPAANSLESGLLTDFVAFALYESGTEEQRRQWLPFFAEGHGIAEIGLSEPAAGSDAQGIKTYARRDGSDWILNGQKAWITNGPIMTVLLCVARTKPAGEPDGLTIFIVPMDSKGVSRQTTDLMVKSCGGVGEIFLDDVRVPAENVLGGEDGIGRGLKTALSLINVGRLCTGARAVAASEVALTLTVDYTRQRRAFGQTIFEFQNTQFQLASAATEIAAGRAMVDSAIARMTAGTLTNADAAKLRLFCTESEGRTMDTCLQMHGGMGYSNEHIISKLYALSRVHRIYGGTSEILRTIIARSL